MTSSTLSTGVRTQEFDANGSPKQLCPRDLWRAALSRIAAEIGAQRLPSIAPAVRALSKMPLSPSLFGTMKLRLASVRRYAATKEWGAAEFELRLLSGRALRLA